MLKPEPATEPTETADHLIGDQQDAVLATDRLDTRPVSVGWNDHAARTLHWFADERGHVLRAKPQDAFLDCSGGSRGEGLRELLAPVTDLYAPQSGHRVQQGLSFGIKDPAALGVRNDAIAAHLLEKSVVLMSGQVVLDIEATQRRKIGDVCSHEKLSGCFQGQGRLACPSVANVQD